VRAFRSSRSAFVSFRLSFRPFFRFPFPLFEFDFLLPFLFCLKDRALSLDEPKDEGELWEGLEVRIRG